MRNARPFNRPSPAPSDMLNRSSTIARNRSASWPPGIMTVVTTGLTRPLARRQSRDSRRGRRPAPPRPAADGARTPRSPSSASMRSASRRPNSRFVAGVVGKNRSRWRRASRPTPSRTRGSRAVFDAASAFSLIALKLETRRQHQAFLRSRERDVEPPLVVAQIDRAQRRHRVDEQQRRMPARVDGAPDLGQPARDPGRRLVMDDEQRFDAMPGIARRAAVRPRPDRRHAASLRA